LFSNPLIGAEINFVPKYKIQEEGRNIKQLMAEVERLKNVKGIEQEKMNMHLENKLKLIEDKFQASLKENEKMKNRFQQKCQQTYEEDYQKYEKIRNDNEGKLTTAKDSTAGILAFEHQKMEELRQRNADLRLKNEQELAVLKDKHARHLTEVQATLAREIHELEEEYQKLLNRMKHYNNKFMNKISLEEADHEREILMYAQYLKKEIEKEKEGGAYFLVENDTFSQQNNAEVTQIYAKQKTVEDLIIENTNLMEEKVKHSLSILKMQEQLLEREKVIINKECDLKQTVDVQKSLENFRFILDKKIAGFIANKGKVMERIREKEESIKKLFAELMHQNELNDVLTRSNALQHNLLLLFLGQEKKKEAQIQYLALKFQGLCEKISAVAGSDATLARKKIEIKGLIAEFDKVGFQDLDHTNSDFTNDKENKANSFTNCIEENARIRDDIANLLRKIELSHKSSKNQVLIEVSKTKNLIEECNKLRQENDYYQKLLKEMTAAVTEAKNSRARPAPVVLKNIG
jgi:hypothetical protein